MPVVLPLDHRDQIQRLRASCQQQIDKAEELYVKAVFAREFGRAMPAPNGNREQFEAALFGIETVGFDLNKRASLGTLINGGPVPWRDLLWPAFRIRRTLAILSDGQQQNAEQIASAFCESVDGLLSHRQPELRYRLRDIDLDTPTTSNLRWDKYLELEVKRAFLLLVRRSGAYRDLNNSVDIISRLRREQPTKENTINDIAEPPVRFLSAIRTLALYNCAKAVEITADYLRNWESTGRASRVTPLGTKDTVDRFLSNACEILRGFDPAFRVQVAQLAQACHALIDASVFSLSLPRRVQQFMIDLSNPQNPEPITELWYAQREAIQRSLLDLTKTAIVLSLATSSGKTLLAELAIIHAYADNSESRVVYLAPTRALVTQISLILKRDFQNLGIKVQVATPAFELNPVESEILKSEYNVLVTTPEKLDLLIASGHESVASISLVVVDEAHNIADEERGAELEFLLAKLRRERNCRFLLMTPFARNASSLSIWLGGADGVPIVVDWKPNDRIVGVVRKGLKTRHENLRRLTFMSVLTPRSDCPPNIEIDLGDVPSNTITKERLALEAAKRFADVKKGGVLLLASSRDHAVDRAESIAAERDAAESIRPIDAVCSFLDTEAGGDHPLSPLLRKRVAFHHAGLSPESRYFVERLVEQGTVDILCATTTLAQGVHFPLSAAVIENYHRLRRVGSWWITEELKPWELWNIIGRVGRTLQDSVGTISFASTSDADVRKIEEYLQRDADIVASSVTEALLELEENVAYDIRLVAKYPALSAFFRYLVHALAVLGEDTLVQSLEDLLRSSFAFLEAQRSGEVLVNRLVRLAREYVAYLHRSKGSSLSGYAQLADGNGFSSFSIDTVLREWGNRPELIPWQVNDLFPEGQTSALLTNVMQTLGTIPEIRLGSQESGEFSAARVARITAAWVNGSSLSDIANQEYAGAILDCTRHIYAAITNLVPWGLNVIQKVAFAGREQIDWETLNFLPSMVLHGVRTKEAIALRMLNVPRFVAENMASSVRDSGISVEQIPDWLRQTSPTQWNEFLPAGARISGSDCKLLWEILDGQKPWSSITS